MTLPPLKQVLSNAQHQHIALGHFNVSTIDTLWAIIRAAQSVNQPVVIGVSEGERQFIGIHQISSLIQTIRQDTGHPIYLNADHCYSLESVQAVVNAGFDSVVFDAADKSIAENTKLTQQVVEYVRAVDQHLLIEAEIGYIGSSSKLMDQLPQELAGDSTPMPTANMVSNFVSQTSIDAVAPAIGNLHGMLKDAPNPNLDLTLLDSIATTTTVPLVLHGGSGLTDDQFTAAISGGISLIHINTEIRVAWWQGLKNQLQANEDTVAPYKLLQPSADAVFNVVKQRLTLFSGKLS